jgi:hypothetical protein
MDCLGSDYVVPQQRCNVTAEIVFCMIRAAAIYRDSQSSWKQLKSKLELVQCSSEQLVNCEDWLNTDWDRGIQIEDEITRRLHSDLKC